MFRCSYTIIRERINSWFTQSCLLGLDNFHIRTVHLDIIKVLFIHQLMH